jgi:DNA-binding transcriptional MerR regulator
MQKLYYSISEVSKIVDEEQHILRYWEKEFSEINPRKNRAGNRVYSQKDLSVIKAIKYLLREEKLSLKSAKEKISSLKLEDFQEKSSGDEIGELIDNSNKSNQFPKDNSINISQTDLVMLKELLIDVRSLLIESSK